MAKKTILDKKALSFLEEYLNNAAPTGYEWDGQKLWMDYLKPYVDTFITDTYGTAVGVINPEATFKVVIEGHADEISWYVNYISDDGLIYVIRNGGSDHQIAPSKIVNILSVVLMKLPIMEGLISNILQMNQIRILWAFLPGKGQKKDWQILYTMTIIQFLQ